MTIAIVSIDGACQSQGSCFGLKPRFTPTAFGASAMSRFQRFQPRLMISALSEWKELQDGSQFSDCSAYFHFHGGFRN